MILENYINSNQNHIKFINSLKGIDKRIAIGAIICDTGGRCLHAIAKLFKVSWAYRKKCYFEYLGLIAQKEETRGRKKLTVHQPNLKAHIKAIIEEYASTDPKFKTEKRYVRLTLKEIRNALIESGNYTEENCIKKSALSDLLKKMGFDLKNVQKTKPLKKIEETDAIFKNVQEKKEQAIQDEHTALISIDTKDKVLIGPFSRKGKNRVDVYAVDHELTNRCLTPFGILDIKKNTPYFFNYTKKPTSCDLVDCIEKFYLEQYSMTKIKRLAILLDNGPDNSGVRTIFLKRLTELSDTYQIEIELIYYPPYHSKYNPVERLWARLENIGNGYLLETEEICLNFMRNLTWNKVNSVTKLNEVNYPKGLKLDKKEMNKLEDRYITRIETLRKWYVLIKPAND